MEKMTCNPAAFVYKDTTFGIPFAVQRLENGRKSFKPFGTDKIYTSSLLKYRVYDTFSVEKLQSKLLLHELEGYFWVTYGLFTPFEEYVSQKFGIKIPSFYAEYLRIKATRIYITKQTAFFRPSTIEEDMYNEKIVITPKERLQEILAVCIKSTER